MGGGEPRLRGGLYLDVDDGADGALGLAGVDLCQCDTEAFQQQNFREGLGSAERDNQIAGGAFDLVGAESVDLSLDFLESGISGISSSFDGEVTIGDGCGVGHVNLH